MRLPIRHLAAALALIPSTGWARMHAQTSPPPDARAQIETFNRALADATRHMDNAATLALWDDDGVSLLPSAAPMIGKKAISEFLSSVMAQIAGSKMERFEMKCFDIQVVGAWASEWCVEHQVVQLADAKVFDGRGKMAFLLRRGADGKWRLKQETWIPGLAADSLLMR